MRPSPRDAGSQGVFATSSCTLRRRQLRQIRSGPHFTRSFPPCHHIIRLGWEMKKPNHQLTPAARQTSALLSGIAICRRGGRSTRAPAKKKHLLLCLRVSLSVWQSVPFLARSQEGNFSCTRSSGGYLRTRTRPSEELPPPRGTSLFRGCLSPPPPPLPHPVESCPGA